MDAGGILQELIFVSEEGTGEDKKDGIVDHGGLLDATGMAYVQENTVLDRDAVVLFTSDVHCSIEQGFGYVGLAAIRDKLEADGNHVMLVDNGDAIHGEPIGTVTNGEAIINLMNAVGYDVTIPGNHEFDYGMDCFLALAEMAEFHTSA